jgi:hypothetical protein
MQTGKWNIVDIATEIFSMPNYPYAEFALSADKPWMAVGLSP